jgi:polar amino acid transport system substrate-binding protein
MVQGPWDKLLDLLERGNFDLALNGLEYSEDKKGAVLLSSPYYVTAQKLTVKKGEALAPRGLDDVKGKAIGCLPGSLAQRMLDGRGADTRAYDVQDDIYEDMVLGRTLGALADEPIAHYYGDIDHRLETRPERYGELRYVIAFRLADAELQRVVDDALAAMAKDGTLRAIYERWGLWNPETAALLHDDDPAPRAVATSFLAWRSAVGVRPPFLERVRHRYPAMLPLFARAASLTLAVSDGARHRRRPRPRRRPRLRPGSRPLARRRLRRALSRHAPPRAAHHDLLRAPRARRDAVALCRRRPRPRPQLRRRRE